RFGLELIGMLTYGAKVVEHPETTAMRCEDEIVALDHEVVDRSFRQVELQRFPLGTVVIRDEDSGFRSGVEKAFPLGIFANCARERSFGNAFCDLRPGFAEVGGLVEVRLQVVVLAAVDGNISCANVEGRRIDTADATPLRQVLRRDIRPVL